MQDRKDALSLAEILSSLSETGIKDEQLQKKLTLLQLKYNRQEWTPGFYIRTMQPN